MKAKGTFFICILFSLFVIIGNKVYLERAQRHESISYIAWDAYGYYLYLPAFIIHQDPCLQGDWPEKLNEKYKPTATFYQVATKDGRRTIIYNIGYSICYLPAFLAGHVIAIIGGFDVDGMSPPYQISMILCALLYQLAAIFFLRKLQLTYFSDTIASLSLIVIFFGTNLYMSTGLSLSMPHNLLFLTNCLYLIYIGKWFKNKKTKDVWIAGLLLGINTIVRPTELILIVVPVFWNLTSLAMWKEQLRFFLQYKRHVIIFIACVAGCMAIQFSYWIYTTRSLEFNFHAQRMSLLDPYTLKFLFSYRKGWLLYTPVMIVGLASFYYIYRFNRNIFWSFLVYTILIIYALSSWECWWYAASFGQRPMVESYSFFAIGFGYFFIAVKEYSLWKKTVVCVLLACFIVLNMFQTWQYTEGIIDGDRMNKKYYWKVFGKTEATAEDKKSLSIDRGLYVQKEFEGDINQFTRKKIFSESYEHTTDSNLLFSSNAHTGTRSLKLDSAHLFSPNFSKAYYDITSKEYMWLRASVWVYVPDSAFTNKNNAALVIYMDSKGNTNKYSTRELIHVTVQPRTWTRVYLDYLTPEVKHSDDKIIVHFWNMCGSEMYIDDLAVEALEPIVGE
ncbi:MAG: hypothetical protein ACTHJT_00245 [Cytophaga sp.]|uniref:hypothetical protein n=1 Tax=Cytophaga sp. TaxID=29535 RepID=UPI003F81EB91